MPPDVAHVIMHCTICLILYSFPLAKLIPSCIPGPPTSSSVWCAFLNCIGSFDMRASDERCVCVRVRARVRGLQDPALIRPGRVDMVQLIDYASESQISKLFRGALSPLCSLSASFLHLCLSVSEIAAGYACSRLLPDRTGSGLPDARALCS